MRIIVRGLKRSDDTKEDGHFYSTIKPFTIEIRSVINVSCSELGTKFYYDLLPVIYEPIK